MQFYMVHKDPNTSAKMLPDYALEKVNLREGWQILSDIGHMQWVTWEGRNKLYSASHAKTLDLCKDKNSFSEFLAHYASCCWEYFYRYGKHSAYYDKLKSFRRSKADTRIYNSLPDDKYEQTRRYLLENKSKHLRAAEAKILLRGDLDECI